MGARVTAYMPPGYQNLSSAQKALAVSMASTYRPPAGGNPYVSQQAARYGYQQALKILPSDPQQQASAPAPAPAPPPPAPTPDPRIAELTKESEAYRAEAEKAISEGKARVAELENEELQRQRAAELQNRLAIQAQTSQARGGAQANLKIAPASQTAKTAGTSAFKRRRDQMRLAPIQSTAGINAPASSVLNV